MVERAQTVRKGPRRTAAVSGEVAAKENEVATVAETSPRPTASGIRTESSTTTTTEATATAPAKETGAEAGFSFLILGGNKIYRVNGPDISVGTEDVGQMPGISIADEE